MAGAVLRHQWGHSYALRAPERWCYMVVVAVGIPRPSHGGGALAARADSAPGRRPWKARGSAGVTRGTAAQGLPATGSRNWGRRMGAGGSLAMGCSVVVAVRTTAPPLG
eukprot:9355022-Pyramimonas_sp.AAC.1